jgi:molecular chaperone DnaK
VDKLNAADGLIFQTEKQLKEFGDKVPADKKGAIETALANLKEAHKSQNLDAVEANTKALNDAWMAASSEMYNSTNETGAPGAQQAEGGSAKSEGENVTDAEFEEVK